MPSVFQKFTVSSAVDILAVAILIYNFVLVLRGRRAMHVLNGLAVLAVVYGLAATFKLELLRTVLATLAPYTAIAVIVMFQTEIRRGLARIGRIRGWGLGGQLERRELVDEIVLAAEYMSNSKIGALIVLERDIGLRTFVESGVALDAVLSRDLLCTIFEPGGPLHDGAVIVQGDRIAAAACFLPLAAGHRPAAGKKHGTRHLAALGVTEESDAIAVVVSEETGGIGLAVRGEMEGQLSAERLRDLLTHYTAGRGGRGERSFEPEWKRAL
jgi:diadenylate cyclase